MSSRLYPERPILAASIAVVRDGRVLLAARAHAPARGLFSLPGGLVEPGERLADAALRELREEVGVEARIGGFVGPVEVIERDEADLVLRHFVVCAHWGTWLSGEPTTGPEALETRWATIEEVEGLPATPGLAGIVRKALALAEMAS
jgi:8-oxo-dGTP diphosphatase